jgi:hypothetical protein
VYLKQQDASLTISVGLAEEMGVSMIEEELPLDHEPSLDHWAKCIADDDIATGYHNNWDYAYEQAWHQLDADYNYSYEY